jgi:hypothetical protein
MIAVVVTSYLAGIKIVSGVEIITVERLWDIEL